MRIFGGFVAGLGLFRVFVLLISLFCPEYLSPASGSEAFCL